LLQQFKLSLQVRNKVTEANQAVIDIRNLRQQINDRLQKVSARRKNEIEKLADAVMVPLTAVEEEAYQVRNRSGQDPLNYPIKLNNKIAALSGVIESADAKPTDQSVEVFNELSAQLDAQIAKMKDTLSKQLPALNAALKREKLDAVDPKAKPAPPAKP
jgi:predicted  nucleic acid-binding Zn-ribbon protein